MKKFWCMLLALCCLLGTTALAETVVSLPQGADAALKGLLADGYEVAQCRWNPGEARADMILTRKGRNRLVILQQQDGVWQPVLNSVGALRQGNQLPDIEQNGDTSFHLIYDNPDGTQDSYTYYTTDGRIWLLSRYRLGQGGASFRIFLTENGVMRCSVTQDGHEGTRHNVYGVYQRDARYLNITALPETLEEARQKLTEPPEIPEGSLSARRVKFTSGKKFAVYSGPGQDYLRASGGKAAVSTNDWIQVFGTEDDWALIQYDVSADQMRIGYIPASGLPAGAQVDELALHPVTAYTTRRTTLTDDPLNSQSALLTLPEGAWVTWLATMGEWAYVESTTGDMVRGFVQSAAITTDRSFDLADHQWDGQPAALEGALIVRADGTVSLTIEAWRADASDREPLRFEAYNETTHKRILTAAFDDDACIYTGQGHMQDGWSVLICPVYENGTADRSAALNIQW